MRKLARPGWWRDDRLIKGNAASLAIVQTELTYEKGTLVKDLASRISDVCNKRRIEYFITSPQKIVGMDRNSIWAVANTGKYNPELESYCSINNIHYIDFCGEQGTAYGLPITERKNPVTIHGINKALDLIIDGEDGVWKLMCAILSVKAEYQSPDN